MNKLVLLALLCALSSTGIYFISKNTMNQQQMIAVQDTNQLKQDLPLQDTIQIKQDLPLTMSNNFKVRAIKGCDLLSGFSLLGGCVQSPFKGDDEDSKVQGSASSAKIAFTELSSLQDIKEVYDYKTTLFGVSLVEKPATLNFTTSHNFKYKHSWVLTDLRTKDKMSYRSTRNLELTEDAFQLFENDPKTFMSIYGEMYVSGFITGAEYNGYMTISTNNENVYQDAHYTFGNSPSQEQVEAFKRKYGNLVDVDVQIQSSINLMNKANLFESHTEFQNKLDTLGSDAKVTLLLSNYDSLALIMREFRNFPLESKDYINNIKKLKDRTLQSITEALQVYNLLQYNLNQLQQDLDGEDTLLFASDLNQIKDLKKKIDQNIQKLSNLDFELIKEIEDGIYDADSPIAYELVFSNVLTVETQTLAKLDVERKRIEQERIRKEEERKKKEEEEQRQREEEERKRQEEERQKREEEERKRQEEEEKKKQEQQEHEPEKIQAQEQQVQKKLWLRPILIKEKVAQTLEEGQMKFFKLTVPLQSTDLSGATSVGLTLSQIVGQVEIYFSQESEYPYITDKYFSGQSDFYDPLGLMKGIEQFSTPLMFQNGANEAVLYFSFWCEEACGFSVIARKL